MARADRDVLAGLVLIAIAAVYAWQALQLELGTAFEMGSGFFPLVVSGLVGLIGLVIGLNGLRMRRPVSGPFAWRALAIVTIAVVTFGAGARPLGFVPAIAITTFLSTLASPSRSWRLSLAVTVLITAACWAIFILGMGIAIPTFGPLFRYF